MIESPADALDLSIISTAGDKDISKSLEDISKIASFSRAMMEDVRVKMTSPDPFKVAPTFSLAQVSSMCGIDKAKANYIVTNNPGNLPLGSIVGGNKKREFALSDAMQWIRNFMPHGSRPEGSRAKKVCIGNFKGGVTKTTTAMSLAQGISLRGRKVLVIDLDPQGSLTTLCGFPAYPAITEKMTIMPYIYGDEDDLSYAVLPSYWSGIDVIPACGMVAHAEFQLPAMQVQDPTFEFWNVINDGIEPLINDYDVIIFDTPPALSYLTINAMMAADAVIVPIPPEGLDYASSVQFWTLFSDFGKSFMRIAPSLANKRYDFFNVLMVKVANQKQSTGIVKDWINKTYRDLVLPIEITHNSGVSTASTAFCTAYDFPTTGSENKVYKRSREELDSFVSIIDSQLMNAWKRG